MKVCLFFLYLPMKSLKSERLMKHDKVSILAIMNRLAITIFYVFVGVTSFAQPSVFEHPQKYWRYSYCYYADFRPVGIPDTGADIEVYDVGEMVRNSKTYRLAYRVRGYLNYNIPSMVDTLLYRWQGGRAYADFGDMCRVVYGGDADALRSDYPCVDDEVVLYDFTLGVDNTFGSTSIREVSTVNVGGEPRKLITLATGHRLLEGIGSLTGGFFEYMKTPLWLPGFTGICTTYLRLYEENDLLVFEQSSEETYDYLLTEEDVQDYLLTGTRDGIVKQEDDKTTAPVYDLQGRKLSSIPAKGIYIQNGKKYVVR